MRADVMLHSYTLIHVGPRLNPFLPSETFQNICYSLIIASMSTLINLKLDVSC